MALVLFRFELAQGYAMISTKSQNNFTIQMLPNGGFVSKIK